ncbi:hypothetical protein LB504_012395 [Fusarium proliferatum]|nr:hypothetical protein LB504_012395 [Fusarium proliferatum]
MFVSKLVGIGFVAASVFADSIMKTNQRNDLVLNTTPILGQLEAIAYAYNINITAWSLCDCRNCLYQISNSTFEEESLP